MKPKTLAVVVCLGVAAGMVVEIVYAYPRLPDLIASHFDFSGQADGWSSKTTFVALYLVTVLICGAALVAPALWLPKIPDALINLPYKEYWLAPERRRDSFDRLTTALLWFGAATELFLWALFHQTIQVNLGQAGKLSHTWEALVVFGVFSAWWMWRLYREFPAPPPKPEDGGG